MFPLMCIFRREYINLDFVFLHSHPKSEDKGIRAWKKKTWMLLKRPLSFSPCHCSHPKTQRASMQHLSASERLDLSTARTLSPPPWAVHGATVARHGSRRSTPRKLTDGCEGTNCRRAQSRETELQKGKQQRENNVELRDGRSKKFRWYRFGSQKDSCVKSKGKTTARGHSGATPAEWASFSCSICASTSFLLLSSFQLATMYLVWALFFLIWNSLWVILIGYSLS